MKFTEFVDSLETAGGNLLLAVVVILLMFAGAMVVLFVGNHIIKDGASWLAAGAILTGFGSMIGVFAALLKGQQKPAVPTPEPVAAPADGSSLK